MARDVMGARVVLLDPACLTPGYVAQLAGALAAERWKVEWVTSRHAFEEVEPPCGVRRENVFRTGPWLADRLGGRAGGRARVAGRALGYPIDLARLDRYLAAGPPGILHVQWAHAPAVEARLWRRWSQKGWSIVLTVHNPYPLEGYIAGADLRLLEAANAILVHDRAARARVINAGAAETKIFVVPPGPPVELPAQQPIREEARRRLGLPATSPLALFFGYRKPYKGLDLLVGAFPRVRSRLPTARLVVAGSSIAHHLSNGRATEGAVYLIEGFVPSAGLQWVFGAADVVVLPYRAASSSGVLLTAWAHERPVVATAVGGLPELLNGGGGVLVPPDDPIALAEAVADFLADAKGAAWTGRAGHRLLQERHSWDEIARRTGDIYRGLCG